jgi:ATP-dependent RNA helicase RhlE
VQARSKDERFASGVWAAEVEPAPPTFATLGLAPVLLSAVESAGHSIPTPIQVAAIPAMVRGDDLLACAQTGSGKTAAFGLALLQKLTSKDTAKLRTVRALVLVPTRELAMQVTEVLRSYAVHMPKEIRVNALFGGVSINPQLMDLRWGADVIVATPGRLLDVVRHNALRLGSIETLVLDEADRLLDLGFAAELAEINALIPKCQIALFSATFPEEVQNLANTMLRSPVRIDVQTNEATAPDIQQRAIAVDVPKRTQLLRYLLQTSEWSRVLVFVATKYTAEHVAEKLRRAGIKAAALHGELSQGARTKALAEFKASKLQVLIATDLAARGIDIVQLPAIVNYDLPRSAVDYVHRIGRTGRAGESGVAVSFVSASTEAHFRLIEKRNTVRLTREIIPGFEPTETEELVQPTAGGVKGKRKSKKDKLRELAKKSGG